MMSNYTRLAAAVFCAALCGSSAVNAAMVSKQGGSVLVSKGSGFVPMTADVEAVPGSRVLVQPGGLASIHYAGNCTVRVGSGFWLVQQSSPCADGATEIDFTGRMNQEGPPEEPPGLNPLVVGGVIVAGITLGVIISQSSNDKPASP